MKKLARFIFSKTILFFLLAVIQLTILFTLVFTFSQKGSYLYIIITILSVFISLGLIQNDKINQAYKMMWISLIVILPVTGFIFYLLWGKRINRKIMGRQMWADACTDITGMTAEQTIISENVEPEYKRTAEYLINYAKMPLFLSSKSEYLPSGEEYFNRLIIELEKAQSTIFMEYFIIDEGYMWNKILLILKQKAAQGVDVRLMYDSFGCLFTLPSNYCHTLNKYRIKAYQFNPLKLFMTLSDYKILNNRDHRKICIIDSNVAFSGGINLADEYINKKKRFGFWKDNGFVIQGPAVLGLTSIFFKNWFFVTKESENLNQYLPKNSFYSKTIVQPFCDSPINYEEISQNAYINILNSAKKYVYITTPYLIIDNVMINSLSNASKSGVDVRIIVPGIPDKRNVNFLTKSYYKVLIESGVSIYEFTPGFVHSKTYVSDDKISIIGTVNMDFRSLYLHFENSTLFYDSAMAITVKDDFINTLIQCKKIDLKDVLKTPIRIRIIQKISRLLAPLM